MQLVWAHGSVDHSSPPPSPEPIKEMIRGNAEGEVQSVKNFKEKSKDNVEANHSGYKHHEKVSAVNHLQIVDVKMSAFPSLHPLVVHFPIVLLLILPLLLCLWIWSSKKEFYYLSLSISGGGTLSAVIASTVLHPHTTGLTEAMRQVLAKHDFWAYSTTLSALISTLILISLIKFKPSKTLKVLLVSSSLYSAIAVSITGHYGATLTHIYGIGPQGKLIEVHNDN